MHPFHSRPLEASAVSNAGGFFFLLMLHEIWMVFISPANTDFSGQTPSTGNEFKRKKSFFFLQN